MDKIRAELIAVTEKFKNEYSASFNRSDDSETLKNNVMFLVELHGKLANELSEITKSYCKKNNIVNEVELDQFKNDLYMSFIQYSTNYK